MTNFDRSLFIKISFLCFLFFIPLVLNGGYYIDDLQRSISGASNWSNNGRPLTDFIIELLTFGLPIVDISPMPQIIGIISLSTAIYFLIEKFLGNDKNIGIICFIPLLMSPFYLENMSYKYDSLTMSLSVLAAVLPAMSNNRKAIVTFTVSAASVMFILNTYQASINAFIIFICLAFYQKARTSNNGEAITFPLSALAGMIVSYGLYSKFISPFYLHGEYTLKHSEIINPTNPEALNYLKNNIVNFINTISNTTPTILKIFMVLSLCCSIALASYLAYSKLRKKENFWVIAMAAIISIPFVITIAIPGAMIGLKYPIFAPRVMIGFNAAYCALTAITFMSMRIPRILKIAYILPILLMFQICYAYMNAQLDQKRLELTIISSIKSATSIVGYDNIDSIAIQGEAPKSPVLKLMSIKYPIIGTLVPITMREGWGWGASQLRHYNIFKNVISAAGISYCEWNVASSTPDYDYYTNGKTFVVDFSKSCKNKGR